MALLHLPTCLVKTNEGNGLRLEAGQQVGLLRDRLNESVIVSCSTDQVFGAYLLAWAPSCRSAASGLA